MYVLASTQMYNSDSTCDFEVSESNVCHWILIPPGPSWRLQKSCKVLKSSLFDAGVAAFTTSWQTSHPLPATSLSVESATSQSLFH